MAGGKDGQTLFHRILLASIGGGGGGRGYNKYDCSRLAFKSQKYRVRCWSYLKLLHLKLHAENHSIHKLILKMKLILGSHELNGYTYIFYSVHPKIIEITFSFPDFKPVSKKSVHSINSFLRYSQF